MQWLPSFPSPLPTANNQSSFPPISSPVLSPSSPPRHYSIFNPPLETTTVTTTSYSFYYRPLSLMSMSNSSQMNLVASHSLPTFSLTEPRPTAYCGSKQRSSSVPLPPDCLPPPGYNPPLSARSRSSLSSRACSFTRWNRASTPTPSTGTNNGRASRNSLLSTPAPAEKKSFLSPLQQQQLLGAGLKKGSPDGHLREPASPVGSSRSSLMSFPLPVHGPGIGQDALESLQFGKAGGGSSGGGAYASAGSHNMEAVKPHEPQPLRSALKTPTPSSSRSHTPTAPGDPTTTFGGPSANAGKTDQRPQQRSPFGLNLSIPTLTTVPSLNLGSTIQSLAQTSASVSGWGSARNGSISGCDHRSISMTGFDMSRIQSMRKAHFANGVKGYDNPTTLSGMERGDSCLSIHYALGVLQQRFDSCLSEVFVNPMFNQPSISSARPHGQ